MATLKLFTITATPVRKDVSDYANSLRVDNYPKQVASLLNKYGFDGFTIYKVDGYWEGQAEVSFKIEIAVDSDPERVYNIANELRDWYNQDCVMLTLPNNSVKFI